MRGSSPRMTSYKSSMLLPQRLQNLHQLGMHELIAADHIAGLQRIIVAFDAVTVPPASRMMIWPAAMSQGCRLRSQ